LLFFAKDLLIEAMAGPKGQCELAHIAAAICVVHADEWEMSSRAGSLNEKFAGNNCPTLLVEYRPSSRYLQQSP
jgi:hypothetical protein